MNSPLPASTSLLDAGPETWADAPDIEFLCKWDDSWDWAEQVGCHGAYHVEPLDYASWSIRFWHVFECEYAAWLDTNEGRFALHLAAA